jgi:hypothetical protein
MVPVAMFGGAWVAPWRTHRNQGMRLGEAAAVAATGRRLFRDIAVSHVSLNTLVWYDFLFRTFAKRFHISARILPNLRDNFTNLSVL